MRITDESRSRIAEFMHAVFLRRGLDWQRLRKTASDCALWYSTTAAQVIAIWHQAHPKDFDK